ncbi:MAG TPA: outer membrane beta-barrel protein, partial [Pedobacter sp.]
TLNEVKIRADKAVIETKSDRFIFNVANSAMAVGSSIDLLKSAPFVKVGADNSVSLQGKKTMILIDNKPVAETSLENILRTLPAGNISQVELITHPSAKYDAAYGAVINIVTKKSKIEGFTGSVIADGSMGRYGMANVNTAMTYKYRGLTVYGTGGLIKGDDLFGITSDRTINNGGVPDVLGNNWKRVTHNKMYSFQVGGDLDLGKDQTIGVVVNGGIYHFIGPWTTANTFRKQGGAIDSVLYTNASFHQPMSTYNYNLNYHLLRDSGKNELTVLTTFTPWKRNLQQYFPSVMYNSAGDVQHIPPTYQTTNTTNINVYIAQADFSHAFNKQWKVETGLKYQHTNSKNTIDYELDNGDHFVNVPAYSSNNELNESIAGLYGILSKDWKADKLQFGVRTEQTRASFAGTFKQNYFNAFPTFLYQHNINENDNLSFSFKRTIARAQYYDLVPYSVFINQYTVEQGNPALKPEYDNIFSVSANIHKLNLSLNYTSAKGMIALFPVKQDFDTKLTYYSRQNLDRSSDYSLYLFFPLRFTSWWETQNSGSPLGYNKAQGQVLGSAYALSAFHSDFKSAHIFQLAKTVKLEVDAYYWTKYVQDLSRYSGYKNIDAAVLIDVFSGKGQLRLAGNEIIFKRNDYRLDHDFGTFSSRELINTDSRRVSVGFTYKFGKTTIKSPEKKLGNEDAMKRL